MALRVVVDCTGQRRSNFSAIGVYRTLLTCHAIHSTKADIESSDVSIEIVKIPIDVASAIILKQ